MILWTIKRGCWKWSVMAAMSLSNAAKYKIDTNLFLIGGNVAELYHQSLLLIEVSGKVNSYLCNPVISSYNLS